MLIKCSIRKVLAITGIISLTVIAFLLVAVLTAFNPWTRAREKAQTELLNSVQLDLKALSPRILQYYGTYGKWPKSVRELEVELPEGVSVTDRFSTDHQPYRIAARGDCAILYSVGPDDIDDNARIVFDPSKDLWVFDSSGNLTNRGDIVVELHY